MKKDIIIFDIDGTLSLVGDRKECLTRVPKHWDEFYNRCAEDEPNIPIIEILFGMCRLHKYLPIYVTGRRESSRIKTLEWFDKHNIILQPEDLFMRPDGDYRHDTILKPELIKHLLPRVLMAFEDRDSMVKKWRELGITCLQVAEGNF